MIFCRIFFIFISILIFSPILFVEYQSSFMVKQYLKLELTPPVLRPKDHVLKYLKTWFIKAVKTTQISLYPSYLFWEK